jgi:F-type H+-transporting ATPase subunit b
MDRLWLKLTVGFLALVLVGWAAGPAWAADPGHDEAGTDLLSPRFDLGIWTLVVFVVLLLVLRKLAWGPMLEGLHRREQNIFAAREEAQRARDESQRIRDQLQHELDQAQDKVRAILEEGRRNAQRATDDMVAKARTDIQTERDRLHREIDMARDQALQQLWSQTAQLATMISAKAIRRQLSPDDHRALVDEAISDLRRAREGNGNVR